MLDILAATGSLIQDPQVQAYGGPVAVIGIVLVRELFGLLRERGKQRNYRDLVEINGKMSEVLATLSERQDETRREARDAADAAKHNKQSLSAMHKRLDAVRDWHKRQGNGTATA